MGFKDVIISFLMDNVRIPISVIRDWLDELDRDRDGYISIKELYDRYRVWRP